jgi:hypothetical protein
MAPTQPVRKPPTPAEVQAQQDRMLEIDRRTARTISEPTTAASVPAVVKSQLPAVPWSHENYLNELAPQTIAGRMVKFTKEGKFAVPDDETVIGEDVVFIANVPETLIGWIKFNGPGNPPDRHMG